MGKWKRFRRSLLMELESEGIHGYVMGTSWFAVPLNNKKAVSQSLKWSGCSLRTLNRVKILIECKEDYNGSKFDYKREEGLSGSPLYLKLGSSCVDGELILFYIDRLNENILLDRLENVLEEIKITPLDHSKH